MENLIDKLVWDEINKICINVNKLLLVKIKDKVWVNIRLICDPIYSVWGNYNVKQF